MKGDIILNLFNKHTDLTLNFDRISHSYLIETNYEDSLTLGIELIKKILKKNFNAINYNDLVKEGNIIIIDNDASVIKTEEIEKIKEKFSIKTLDQKPYFYIINNCEKMNKSSVNKILKFLEEPTEKIYSIFITSNRNNLIRTLVSRCQILRFNVNKNEFLGQKNEYTELLFEFVINIEKNKEEGIAYLNNNFYETINSRNNLKKFLEDIKFIYNDVLHLAITNKVKYFDQYKDELNEILKKNTIKKIHDKVYIVSNLMLLLIYNPNIKLFIDRLILELSGVDKNE